MRYISRELGLEELEDLPCRHRQPKFRNLEVQITNSAKGKRMQKLQTCLENLGCLPCIKVTESKEEIG